MDKIEAINKQNPSALARGVGQELKRSAKGWTQDELSPFYLPKSITTMVGQQHGLAM